ncbi:MAG: molybdopterin-dependent oxidoreductase [Desulfohalobiaceae bacterium]|nr:molybdopterin-dependent oxidoreductase [Desulfohalobiaceae bacterium]
MLTACTKDCPDACSLIVTESDKGFSIKGNPEHPITLGLTCGKIQNHLRRLQSKNRITAPLLKKEGSWQEISWDQALDFCAKKIKPVLDRDPSRLLHIHDGGARGVTKETAAWFFRKLGCSVTHGSLCDATGIQASLKDFGALKHNDIRDLGQADWIVNWGREVTSSSIHLAAILQKARKNGTRVLSICPGGRAFRSFSDRIMTIPPGRDRFLALAVLKLLQDSGQLDSKQQKQCNGLPEHQAVLDQHSLTELQDLTGINEEDIRFLADIYAKRPVASLLGWGLQRHLFGGENVRWINALAWQSGNVGIKGAGIYFNMSSNSLLDYSWLGPTTNRSLSLPAIGSEIKTADPGIELAWIARSNVVNQAPDSRRLAEVFTGIDCLVVVDAFMTDTAACADLILPPSLMWEEEDLVGSCLHYGLQYAARAVSPPPGVRSDLGMVKELNDRLGGPAHLPSRQRCLENCLRPYSQDITLQKLKTDGFAWIEENPVVFQEGTDHPDGRFQLITHISPEPEPDPDYPLRLLSLINKNFIHSQVLPAEHVLPPRVECHPRAPGVPELDLNQKIFLVSPLGRLEVDLVFDHSLETGTIVYRRGDWMRLGGGVNQLIKARLTDLGVGAAYYQQQVRLENEKRQ